MVRILAPQGNSIRITNSNIIGIMHVIFIAFSAYCDDAVSIMLAHQVPMLCHVEVEKYTFFLLSIISAKKG